MNLLTQSPRILVNLLQKSYHIANSYGRPLSQVSLHSSYQLHKRQDPYLLLHRSSRSLRIIFIVVHYNMYNLRLVKLRCVSLVFFVLVCYISTYCALYVFML